MTPSAEPERPESPAHLAPRPLLLACALTVLEAAVLVIQGLALLPALDGRRLTMGITSLAFFIVYGGFLAFAAWQLRRLQSWARAPIVLAQLIQILVGINFWGGETTWVAVLLIVVGVAVLVGIFHPDSLAALEAADA